MKFRSAVTQFAVSLLAATFWTLPAIAQNGQPTATSATAQGQADATSKVSAELVKGKLNPSTSKPGDQVTVRTTNDVKSNGQVVLRKGTEINGIVRSVKQADAKGDAKGNAAAQSMMQVEWLPPTGSAASTQQLNFALQSVAYTNPLYAHQQQDAAAEANNEVFAAAPRPAPRPSAPAATPSSGGGLLGGAGATVSGALSGTTSTTLGSTGTAIGDLAGGTGVIAGQGAAAAKATGSGNAGLLAMPSLIPVNSQTASSLQNNFGVSSNQLFMVGHGQSISAGGTPSSMDIFSHMSNDAVITSPSRNFEVGSGAQMDFLVNARRQQ